MKNNFKIDFIGIGAAKSGTSWIAQCLREHPEVNFSIKKELSFFNKQKGIYSTDIEWHYPKGIEWYRKHFKNNPEKITGEFTTDYIYDKNSPILIRQNFPNVKIIVCLRNPVEMVYSEYWWYKGIFKLENAANFEEALKSQPQYVDRAKYYCQLRRYFDNFDKDNIHIIIYDDIKHKPEEVIKNLYSFLGVDANFIPESLCKKVNSSRKARYEALTKVFSIVTIMQKYKLDFVFIPFKKIGLYQQMLTLYIKLNSKNFKYPEMDCGTRKYLKEVFREDINKTEQLINIFLDIWK